jgi:hypothetical protein
MVIFPSQKHEYDHYYQVATECRSVHANIKNPPWQRTCHAHNNERRTAAEQIELDGYTLPSAESYIRGRVLKASSTTACFLLINKKP